MNDDQLHQLLRATPPPISLPPSFTREVWARIETAQAPSLRSSFSQALLTWLGMLSRPAPALATIVLCMVVGGGLGWIRHQETFQAQGELAYVASINPFLHGATP